MASNTCTNTKPCCKRPANNGVGSDYYDCLTTECTTLRSPSNINSGFGCTPNLAFNRPTGGTVFTPNGSVYNPTFTNNQLYNIPLGADAPPVTKNENSSNFKNGLLIVGFIVLVVIILKALKII